MCSSDLGRSCLRLGEYKNGVGSETFDVAGVSDGALTFVGAKNKPAFAGGVRFGCQPGLFVELVIDQFQAENTPIPSARISTRKMERTIRPTRGLLFGTEAVAGEDGTDRSAVETEDDPRNCCVGLAVRVCSGAKDTGDDEGFLLVSLVARAAGWKLCGTEEEGRAVRLAGFTDDAWSERFAGAKLAGWLGALCEREESVDGMVFLRPDDGMKLGGTLVGSFAPLPSLMVPPKRFVPASYVERGRDCVVYVSSLPERHIRSH